MPGTIIVPSGNVRPVLTKHRIVVGSEGELVSLTVGNVTMKMHYEEAITLSNIMRVKAKQVKKEAGDVSRHWSAIAVPTELK